MFRAIVRFFGRTPETPMIGDWFLNDRFQEFRANPSHKTFQAVRRLVMEDKSYRAVSTAADDLALLLEHGRLDEVRARVRGMMPGWLLSPRVHRIAAEGCRQYGDAEQAEREERLYQLCIDGIMASGDGTRDRPYPVTHVGDEYDLLDYLGRKPTGFDNLDHEGKSLVSVHCQDGSVIWFDLTEFHAKLDDPPRLSPPTTPAARR